MSSHTATAVKGYDTPEFPAIHERVVVCLPHNLCTPLDMGDLSTGMKGPHLPGGRARG